MPFTFSLIDWEPFGPDERMRRASPWTHIRETARSNSSIIVLPGRPPNLLASAHSQPPKDRTRMPISRALPRLRFLAATVIASASLLVLTAAPAHAGLLVKSATNCDTETLTQPFMR